jgi:hypothetical protein
MKKLIYTSVIVLSNLMVSISDPQIHVNVGVNIVSQPASGPVGYE